MSENKDIKELAKELCETSGCHHKCSDTDKCVVEEEALLLMNENKSNKQIEELKRDLKSACITHYKQKKCTNFESCKDCQAAFLYNEGYRKQSEGEWVSSDIPQEKYVCSVCGGACWYYDFQGDVAKSRYCPNCGAKMLKFD